MSLKLLSNIHFDKEYNNNFHSNSVFSKFANLTSDGSCFSITTSANSILFYDIGENIDNASKHFTDDRSIPSILNIEPRLTLKTHDDVRDFCWFPNFSRSCPDSWCFLIAVRNKPVNLYDSLKGSKHLTYKPINAVGEIAQIYSIDFHPLGKYFICGSSSCVYVFDVESPGEHLELRKLSTRKTPGQKGIVSCISHNGFGNGNTYACGSYNSTISIYDHNVSRDVSIVGDFLDPEFPLNPITHLKWIDECKMLVGCRNDFYLRLYDVRGDVSVPVQRFHRPVTSNQKVTFDYRENLVVSGTSNGDVVFYDLLGRELHKEQLSTVAIPVCNFIPSLPLLLLCSGTRNFKEYNLDSPTTDSEPSSNYTPSPVAFSRLYFTDLVK
ncbi:hypothetical protein MACK_002183 [Theileria orientalis]|uniref:Uncharacterized protein n=1 Tax=Theileria orientalis TaxID=68886 RepID=A0A976QUU0_THEOR|nr:hypothetical protein MACK_002183 [Theileria orientalis]